MTQEEKARAYDEALKKLHEIIIMDNHPVLPKEIGEFLFPELAESEDERIRKWILEYLYDGLRKSDEQFKEQFKDAIAWLEKQKETSHIQETCKKNADSFTAEEDGPFDEDEFLEDELSAFLQNYDKEYDDDAAVSDVARHFYEIGKKQNEQKSVPFSCGHENGKPAEWAELQSEFKNINEAFEDGKKEVVANPEKYGLTKQKPADFPTTDEEVKEFLETHPKVEVPEKYKTPDFVFSKQEYESHPIISKDTTSTKPVELDGKALLYTADKSYQIGFRDGVASVKPAEWSEDIIQKAVKEVGLTQYQIDWFKTNVFQPKREWSDEDEAAWGDLMWCIEQARKSAKDENDMGNIWFAENWVKNRLKSLRPQPKEEWSEEDEDMLNSCISSIEEAKENRYAYKETDGDTSYDREIDWLKSLRPLWKPTDEQIKALNALNLHGGLSYMGQQNQLISLYQDLKKLM